MQQVSAPPGRPHRGPGIALAVVLAVVVAAAVFVTIAMVRGVRELRVPPPVTTDPVAAKVIPGMAYVTALLSGGRGVSAGTGMVLTPAGRVLTNNHVIDGSTAVSVADLGDGRTYQASVVGYDENQDVAVLQLTGASGLKTVSLGTAPARVGDAVIAFGNAGGLGGIPEETAGTVTGTGASITAADEETGASERLTGLIRTSVPLRAGDSGGPLVSRQGLVIGMNTAASSQYLIQSGGAEGFAIPIARAAGTCAAIVAGRGPATVHIGPTAFLGVSLVPSAVAVPGRPPATGAGITAVSSGTPAAAAGLGFGDVIISLGGRPVTSPEALRAALVPRHPGNRVSLTWVDQERQEHTAFVVLAAGPAG